QLVKNNYVQSQWGQWYMFGDDGKIVTGPHMWQGSMYYFDPDTYGVVKNDYRVPTGEKTGYLLGSEGQALTGFQNWQGSRYYFNPSNYKLVTNSYLYVDGNLYYVDGSGFINKSSFSNALNQYIVNNHIGHANIVQHYVIPQNTTGAYRGTSNGLPNMVIVHETANPNDSIWGEINYEANTYNKAFVHAFVDGNNIIEISSTDHEAWGAGYPANSRAVQFEQVEVHSAWEFAREISNAAYYTAYNMHKYGMTPSLGGTLYSHHMISQTFGGTDHTDPDAYWSRNASMFGTGYTMNDFYQLVQAYYAAI
uniref:peptidoglycan recognition protein family protein n=1 Tax=uncultured Limosilactobacillus sp. TaxID=2837629 RepID=UPI0025DBEF3D